jgi:hypothetical protein
MTAVSLERLAVLDRVRVRTLYSVYEIIVSEPRGGKVLVRGGKFFPEFTAARIAGSTAGGSWIRLRSVEVGLRLEFSLGQQFVLTSAVQSIDVIDAAVA